jgi:hypothetical protein
MHVDQIEKDLHRTFLNGLDTPSLDSLRRLLLAYARHNPEIGYCQGMELRRLFQSLLWSCRSHVYL